MKAGRPGKEAVRVIQERVDQALGQSACGRESEMWLNSGCFCEGRADMICCWTRCGV